MNESEFEIGVTINGEPVHFIPVDEAVSPLEKAARIASGKSSYEALFKAARNTDDLSEGRQ